MRALQNFPIMRAVDLAEAKGDPFRALDLMEADQQQRPETETFWHPERVQRLLQLATYGSVLPKWATSRWILAQAVRWMDESQRRRFTRAFDRTVEVAGGADRYEGVDEIDSRCKLMDYDWVYRQLVLYEYGGLRHFLDTVASQSLIDHADSIREWVDVPIGAYRLVDEEALSVRWLDLASGREIETANIGSASSVGTGAHVIGRLVPTEHGTMFESAPLLVPPEVASWVAEAPDDWTSALQPGCQREGPLDQRVSTRAHGFPLLSDVPAWREFDLLEPAEALDTILQRPADDLLAAQVDVVRAAMEEVPELHGERFDEWPVVGSMLLDPAITVELALHRRPRDAAGFRRLAARVASPSAEICRALEEACFPAA